MYYCFEIEIRMGKMIHHIFGTLTSIVNHLFLFFFDSLDCTVHVCMHVIVSFTSLQAFYFLFLSQMVALFLYREAK